MRSYACLRSGRIAAARRYAEGVPKLSSLIEASDYDGLLSYYRKYMEEHILVEMSALEAGSLPDHHKTARRAQLSRHHAAVRAQQRRVEASALYRQDGAMRHTHADIGDEFRYKWLPIFAARPPDPDAARICLPYVQAADLDPMWTWRRGMLRDIARRARDTTSGTDGLGYSFWANAPDCALAVLDDVAVAAQTGSALPPALHASRTVCIPKAELLADPEDVRPTADALRPLTMITTGEKLIALRVNDLLAPVAARTVAPPQRGFVCDRRIADDVVGLDGAMVALSLRAGRRAAAVLFDFANALPALSHTWIFEVLRVMLVPECLINIIAALYRDLRTDMYYSGVVVTTIDLCSGIRQGCPLSGTVFALALDPFVRWYLCRPAFQHTHFSVCRRFCRHDCRHLSCTSSGSTWAFSLVTRLGVAAEAEQMHRVAFVGGRHNSFVQLSRLVARFFAFCCAFVCPVPRGRSRHTCRRHPVGHCVLQAHTSCH